MNINKEYLNDLETLCDLTFDYFHPSRDTNKLILMEQIEVLTQRIEKHRMSEIRG